MKKVFSTTPLTEQVQLPEADTHHILNVLRHAPTKPLRIAHAEEGSAWYRLVEVEPAGTSVWERCGEIEPPMEKTPVILVQAFLKNDKLEWVLQKTAELDVTAVWGVASKHAVAKYDAKKLAAKEVRWRKIQQEAAQQCGRDTIPTYASYANWESLLQAVASDYPDSLRLVAYENEESYHIREALRAHFSVPGTASPVIIVVGPEGGLAESEVARLAEAGFQAVTLGDTILRAETAAITAVALMTYERG